MPSGHDARLALRVPSHAIALIASNPTSVLTLSRTPCTMCGQQARLAWAETLASSLRALDVLGYPPDGRWSEKQCTGELSHDRSTAYVARADGELVAFASTDRVLDETSLLSIVVHPSWRGCGLGRTLLLTALSSARAAGHRCLTLEVRPSNTAAMGLYSRCGLQIVGRRPKYYKSPPPPEDAVLFTAAWDDAAAVARLEALIAAQPEDVRSVLARAADAARCDEDGSTACEGGDEGVSLGVLRGLRA